MPVYEYQCKDCGKITELFQRMSDDPLSSCDSCEGSVKKLISQSTFHLKGGGWYVDDYSNGTTQKSTTSSEESKKDKKETETKAKPASDAPKKEQDSDFNRFG